MRSAGPSDADPARRRQQGGGRARRAGQLAIARSGTGARADRGGRGRGPRGPGADADALLCEAELDVDGGIQITGSHNPANYNGFKMVLFGQAFFGARIQELGRMAAAADWETGGGSARDEDVMDRYVDRLMRDFDGQAFRIGWDAGNGAAGPILERLVRSCPASTTCSTRRWTAPSRTITRTRRSRAT
jgi:phosphomannomutase